MEASSSRTSDTKYERLRRIGIGSYGIVFKCVNRQTGQIVAIKRYFENDSDPVIRKIAMREVRMLRQLNHPNLIHLLEVFRRRQTLHLVFDYCELTVLDVIERYANNCPLNLIRKIIWQLVNGVSHCHSHNCIHRDIKPENILINQAGIVKLCDFGFARNLINPTSKSAAVSSPSQPGLKREFLASRQRGQKRPGQVSDDHKENLIAERQALTEYVATRWYRAPELLVGDIYYDTKIDIWAVGCVAAELMRGKPLWPGKTDMEQLCLIKNSLGQLTPDQTQNLLTRGIYEQAKIERCLSQNEVLDPLDRKLPGRVGLLGIDFVLACLEMDPARRPTSEELLKHDFILSALMGRFVRSTVSGYSGGRSLQRGEHTSAAAPAQKPVEREALARHAVEPVGYARLVHRSNSQAILMAAASQQQQLGKRLDVAGPESSSDNQRADVDHAAAIDSKANAPLRSANKQINWAPGTHRSRTRPPLEAPRSQSQSTVFNEFSGQNRGSSVDRSSRVQSRPIPGVNPQSVLQSKRTSEYSNRADSDRPRQIQRNHLKANNVAVSTGKGAHKLPAGHNDQPVRNTTDNSAASTSNSTISSFAQSSLSTGRHDRSLVGSLNSPAAVLKWDDSLN